MSDDFKSKANQFTEAWNTGNVDMLDKVLAANVVYHMPPFPDTTGLDACKRFFVDMHHMCPDLHMTLEELIVQGNATAGRWTWRGTFTGPSSLIPIPPTGKAATNNLICGIGHWVDGKMAEVWQIGDMLGWLQQIGVLPPMG